jgi:hypothetical protein
MCESVVNRENLCVWECDEEKQLQQCCSKFHKKITHRKVD